MEQSSVMILLRRLGIPSVQAVRLKTRHFKPKIAAVRSQKTPSMLALDHFDFYYGPLYGPKHWPSIRLGLLNPNKFIAVLNRLSEDVEANEAILRELSTVNVIEMLTQGSKPPPKPKDFKGIPNNQLNENQVIIPTNTSLKSLFRMKCKTNKTRITDLVWKEAWTHFNNPLMNFAMVNCKQIQTI